MEIKNARGRRAMANIYEDFRGIDIEDYLERIVDQYDFPQLERDEIMHTIADVLTNRLLPEKDIK